MRKSEERSEVFSLTILSKKETQPVYEKRKMKKNINVLNNNNVSAYSRHALCTNLNLNCTYIKLLLYILFIIAKVIFDELF